VGVVKKEEELINRLRETNFWAASLQETLRVNKTAWENNGYIFVEGTDAHASLGVRDRHDNNEATGPDRVMGRYGIPHVNAE
jgi:hypothetical protein